MTLEGKVALVTGATRGIGLAIARRLFQEGAALSLCGRDEARLRALKEEFEKAKTLCLVTRANVSNTESVKEMVEKTLDKFRKIDILVNNAGIAVDNLVVRLELAEWQSVVETNLTGTFLVTRSVAKEMIRARYGRIVNISSVIGIMGNAGQAAYAASKAGIIGFTKSVARELASRAITCNAVAPGFIETDMTGVLSEEARRALLPQIPLGRFGTVEDVAEVVQFLVSEEAGYLTGQVIRVDGGMVTS